MSRVYAKTRRSLLYIVMVLVGAFTITAYVLVSQETAISASKDRNAQFHVPSMLHAGNAAKSILRTREQMLIDVTEYEHEDLGQFYAPRVQPAEGYQPFQVIRNDYERLLELHAVFGGSRYEATLQKIAVQYGQLRKLEGGSQSDLENLILSMQLELARLNDLYLSFNQLERLHIGSYEELETLIQRQIVRRNLVGIPVSTMILLGALATIAYLASQTQKALRLQERSEDELQSLNKELEHIISVRTKSLAQSRETYKTLFERAPIAYYDLRPDGVITRWNEAAERLFGVSGKDLRGKNITEFYHPASLTKAKDLLARFVAGQNLRNEEMIYVRPDGDKCYSLLSATPIFDDDGKIIESLAMDVDITELRKARDRVSAMQQKLLVKERLAAIGQVIASVSHELRNPLGAIRSAADALRRLVGDGSDQTRRALALLERSQVRCERIIADLLNYTRVQELQLRDTQIDAWLTQVLDDCGIPSEVDVHFELGFRAELPIDRERMERAVLNVVDNACDAMNSDAEGATRDGKHELIVTTRLIDQRFELSITDTGCGFEQDLQTKIFEPLFTTKPFGVGLGLPIVQRTMEQHGGGISISSRPGEGTEVVLWIPAEKKI